eukprot:gene2301-1438_t
MCSREKRYGTFFFSSSPPFLPLPQRRGTSYFNLNLVPLPGSLCVSFLLYRSCTDLFSVVVPQKYFSDSLVLSPICAYPDINRKNPSVFRWTFSTCYDSYTLIRSIEATREYRGRRDLLPTIPRHLVEQGREKDGGYPPTFASHHTDFVQKAWHIEKAPEIVISICFSPSVCCLSSNAKAYERLLDTPPCHTRNETKDNMGRTTSVQHTRPTQLSIVHALTRCSSRWKALSLPGIIGPAACSALSPPLHGGMLLRYISKDVQYLSFSFSFFFVGMQLPLALLQPSSSSTDTQSPSYSGSIEEGNAFSATAKLNYGAPHRVTAPPSTASNHQHPVPLRGSSAALPAPPSSSPKPSCALCPDTTQTQLFMTPRRSLLAALVLLALLCAVQACAAPSHPGLRLERAEEVYCGSAAVMARQAAFGPPLVAEEVPAPARLLHESSTASTTLMDYCPIVAEYSNTHCSGGDKSQMPGSVLSDTARCLDSASGVAVPGANFQDGAVTCPSYYSVCGVKTVQSAVEVPAEKSTSTTSSSTTSSSTTSSSTTSSSTTSSSTTSTSKPTSKPTAIPTTSTATPTMSPSDGSRNGARGAAAASGLLAVTTLSSMLVLGNEKIIFMPYASPFSPLPPKSKYIHRPVLTHIKSFAAAAAGESGTHNGKRRRRRRAAVPWPLPATVSRAEQCSTPIFHLVEIRALLFFLFYCYYCSFLFFFYVFFCVCVMEITFYMRYLCAEASVSALLELRRRALEMGHGVGRWLGGSTVCSAPFICFPAFSLTSAAEGLTQTSAAPMQASASSKIKEKRLIYLYICNYLVVILLFVLFSISFTYIYIYIYIYIYLFIFSTNHLL